MGIPSARMPDERVNAVRRRSKRFRTLTVTVPDGTAVGGQPVKLLDQDDTRVEAWVFNNGTVTIAIGEAPSVGYAASSNPPGFLIGPGNGVILDSSTSALYAVANGAAADVRLAIMDGVASP